MLKPVSKQRWSIKIHCQLRGNMELVIPRKYGTWRGRKLALRYQWSCAEDAVDQCTGGRWPGDQWWWRPRVSPRWSIASDVSLSRPHASVYSLSHCTLWHIRLTLLGRLHRSLRLIFDPHEEMAALYANLLSLCRYKDLSPQRRLNRSALFWLQMAVKRNEVCSYLTLWGMSYSSHLFV